MKLIGHVSHYYTRLEVAAIHLVDQLAVGDLVQFLGHTTDFQQRVSSMEENLIPIEVADRGQSVGVRVEERVRQGDRVYKVPESEES
jgi:putative protease